MSIVDRIALERAAETTKRRRSRPEDSLRRSATPPRPCFSRARPFMLIAECKRASPSRGIFLDNYDPVALGLSYEAGGAGMISVLTEPAHFLGSDANLTEVREAVALPVLRKDFIVDPYQVTESWAIGADAILLIASLHDSGLLRELAALAHARGLSVLLEVHEEGELERALGADADAIGINARDLRDFRVDPGRAKRLGASLDTELFKVAESGLKNPADAAAMLAAGFRGFLVGEALVTSGDPEAATRAFALALREAAESTTAAFAPGATR